MCFSNAAFWPAHWQEGGFVASALFSTSFGTLSMVEPDSTPKPPKTKHPSADVCSNKTPRMRINSQAFRFILSQQTKTIR